MKRQQQNQTRKILRIVNVRMEMMATCELCKWQCPEPLTHAVTVWIEVERHVRNHHAEVLEEE